MRNRRFNWLLLVACTFATPVARAAEILDYLPEDALGFVLIRDIEQVNGQSERLLQMFGSESPAPLAFVKLTTGLAEGLDFDGDFLAALLPGPRPADPPEPLVILPVADYAKFAASINGDETGEVCRVTIAGEDVLVARHGPYAMLMDVEHRETLEILVGLEAAPVELVKPWDPWMKSNGATVAILPPGLEKLLALGRQGLDQQRQQWRQEFGEPELADVLTQVQHSLAAYQAMLDLVGGKVHAAAVGVSVTEANDVRFGLRLMLDGTPRAAVASPPATAGPLAGYPDEPFVFAGGGPVDKSTMRTLTFAAVQLMKQSPAAYGYDGFDDAAWLDLEKSYIELAEPVQSASVLMTPGEKGDALMSNIFGVSTVESATGYLGIYKKAVETWNRLTAQSTSDIKVEYEVTDLKIAGSEACEVVGDVAAAARDPNVPMFNWMLEAMFGAEGKLRTLAVAAEEKTLVVGLTDQETMTRVVERVRQRENGLQNSADVQATDRLLPPEAAWRLYVSPRGCVTWFQRVLDEFFKVMQQTYQLPEYAAGPPVGISLRLEDSQAEVDVVWPARAVTSLADFVKKCREL